jgi:proteasome lid subunit RPN8/RPN11
MSAEPAAGTFGALSILPGAPAPIERHSVDAFPHECCGPLLISEGAIIEAHPLANTTEGEAARRFLVGPDAYREAEAWARGRGGTLGGFYHSHPNHPARPSQHDLDHAWPNFVYVIVSVMAGTARDITCWRLREDRSAFEQGDLKSWRTES